MSWPRNITTIDVMTVTITVNMSVTVVLQLTRDPLKKPTQEQQDGIRAESRGLFPASTQIGLKIPSVVIA